MKWYLILAGCVVAFSAWLLDRLHWSVAIAVAYTLFNGMQRFAFTWRFSTQATAEFIHKWHVTYSCLTIVLFAVLVATISVRQIRILFFVFAGLEIPNAALMIFQSFSGQAPLGFVGEPSMNACVMSLAIPVLLSNLRYRHAVPLVALLLWAIVSVNSTSAIAVTAVCLGVYLWRAVPRFGWVLLGLVPIVFYAVGEYTQGYTFTNPGNRIVYQKIIMDWFFSHSNHAWLGLGTGSLVGLLPGIQVILRLNEYWQHLHSDLLKCLFENGIVGTVLWSVPIAISMRRLFREPCWFALCVGSVGIAIVQYPCFLPFHAMVCTLAIGQGTKKASSESEIPNQPYRSGE